MGLGSSRETREAEARHRRIEKELTREADVRNKTVKLLLLGASEAGKSTILKQMRILHDNGFTEEEYKQQRAVVWSNLLRSMLAILVAMDDLDIRLEDPSKEIMARLVAEVVRAGDDGEPFTKDIRDALEGLWDDEGLQRCFARSSEFHISDSTKYFFDHLDRIGQPDFSPTNQDVLRCQAKTTGVVEVRFRLENLTFRVVDVGGQRSERKKWIHCFEDVNAVLFITALSEYDLVLAEDPGRNRMKESRCLFESICNSRWFLRTSIILFLNKRDIFEEKIKTRPLSLAFPSFKGPQGFDTGIRYIKRQFEAGNLRKEKQVYTHVTCATDTDQVKFVLSSCMDVIVSRFLEGCGLY